MGFPGTALSAVQARRQSAGGGRDQAGSWAQAGV